jgi:hypothetical protein
MWAQQTPPDGQKVYQSRGAMWHEMANTAPFMNHHILRILKAIAPENIVSALWIDAHPGVNLSGGARGRRRVRYWS